MPLRKSKPLFWDNVDVAGPDDCWPWTGAARGSGYGGWGANSIGAHRVAYQLIVGLIPPGLVIDHLCHNRACCNPAHMEVVTNAENVRRGFSTNAAKTHCPKGHPYDETNTYRPARGGRMCRICQRAECLIRTRERRARERAAR